MSLEWNRLKRLLTSNSAMNRLLEGNDFASGEIEAYRRELFVSLRALDAGLASSEIGALEGVYEPPATPSVSGDTYVRREVSPGVYQCGCRWERTEHGDTMRECAIHGQATSASVDAFERREAQRASEAKPCKMCGTLRSCASCQRDAQRTNEARCTCERQVGFPAGDVHIATEGCPLHEQRPDNPRNDVDETYLRNCAERAHHFECNCDRGSCTCSVGLAEAALRLIERARTETPSLDVEALPVDDPLRVEVRALRQLAEHADKVAKQMMPKARHGRCSSAEVKFLTAVEAWRSAMRLTAPVTGGGAT